jgi:hypothetical protein
MKRFWQSIFFFSWCTFSKQGFSQNMNSPYSIYGVGDIDSRIYNRTSGMASTGLALHSSAYIVNNNPAGIAGVFKSLVILNIVTMGKTVQYSGAGINTANRNNKDFWIKGISLAVKLNKFWASNIGFRQFSNVNYKFTGSKNVVGSDKVYSASYEGDGGLNDFYWTNAFSIGKHFSVGIKSSIIAGSINRTELLKGEWGTNEILTKQQDYYGSPQFEYGIIYTTPVNKNWDLSIGGKYINKTKLASERTLTVTENNNVIVDDKFIKATRFYLPRSFGLGIGLTHNKKTSFNADYTFQDWSDLKIKGDGWRLVSSSRLSAGIGFSNIVSEWNKTFEKNYFQIGGFICNSYLRVRNTPLNEFGITTGLGGRLSGNLLYNLSLELGKRGTTRSQLIKENFLQFTLGLTYAELILSKKNRFK